MRSAGEPAGLDRRAWIELLAVLLTGALHLVFRHVIGYPVVFIVLCSAGWVFYVSERVRRDRSQLAAWGFRRANLREAWAGASLVALAGLAGMAAFAWARGTLVLHPHMLLLLALYPVWGLVQEFMIQGLVSANLARARGSFGSRGVITIVSASAFGLVHLPDLVLTAGTFLLGLAFTPLYLRFRNLWPLGVYHGWLGVFVYFWVLGQDPWVDIFHPAR